MIASDIDGTLLNFGDHETPPGVNFPLILNIASKTNRIALITNQGGLPWGLAGTQRADGRCYPHPRQFVDRVCALANILGACGIQISELRVAVCSPRAGNIANLRAASTTRRLLKKANLPFPIHIYSTERARKPNQLMLKAASAHCYYGDSDEDAAAACAAGIEFVKIERFK